MVAGTTATAGFNTGVDDFGLAEYNPDGTLNTSFGTDGTVITDIFNQFNGGGPLNHAVSGLALEMVAGVPKMVVAGTAVVQTSDGGVVDFALRRYNLDGSLDTTFGNGGEITISPTTSQQFASGVAVQADGKIVAIGQVEDPSGNFNQSFCVVRVNTDGNLDSSFGKGGIVITDLTPPGTSFFSASPTSIAIQPDGRIVVGGSDSAGSNLALVRYKKDGKLDASFGNHGIVMLDSSVPGFPITDMTLQSDGKIVAVGSHFTTFSPTYGPIFDFGVARFTSKGNLDPSFGTGGIVIIDLTPPGLNLQYSYDDNATGVVIQPDGKVVVGGWTSDPNTYPNANGFNPKMPTLVRYDTSGSLDPTFGAGGISITGLSGSTFQGMALQPDGKILLPYTADANPWGGTDFGLARFLGMDLAIAGPVSGVRNKSLEFMGSFDGQQTDNTTGVTWQFGDGTTLKFHSASDPGALDVTHVYRKSGAYAVTLTVEFDGGGTLTTSWQVSIQPADLLTDTDHPSHADAVVKDTVSSGGRSDLALGNASGDSLTGGSGRGTLSRRGADLVVGRPGGGAGKYSVYLDLALDILLARDHSKIGASIIRRNHGS